MPPTTLLVAIMLIEYLVSSTALAFTTRQSIKRQLCLLLLISLAFGEIRLLFSLSGPQLLRGVFAFSCLVKLLHFTSLFLIQQVEIQQILNPQTSKSCATRLRTAFNFLTSTRGIGTSWEVKSRRQVQHSSHARLPTKRRYISSTILVLFWQYLALDLLGFGGLRYFHREWPDALAVGTEFPFLQGSVTKEQLLARIPLSCILVANLRLLFAMIYGLLSVVCVGLQLSSPADWTPVFGTVQGWARDGYSIRSFWGQYWHQLLRFPLVTISGFIRRNLLPTSVFASSTEAQTQAIDTVLVFCLSGILHMLSAVYAGVPDNVGAIFLFFAMQPVAIIAEHSILGMVHAPERHGNDRRSNAHDDERKERRGRGWQLLLGPAWTLLWFYLSAPWFAYTALRLPVETNAAMPFSFVEAFGPRVMAGVVCLSWLSWNLGAGVQTQAQKEKEKTKMRVG
ncbi:membrane bound O-acyl transferase family-domain-containing protein [Aspergillus pseudoustus]|uniref:Membrane bound O-acyl transferase family-domain-containing protein n=1 Tax=Aspergillus pseudoustus TaxID=1810923 RepID=A0ABR4IU65_9EURO